MKVAELMDMLQSDSLPNSFENVIGNGEKAGQKRKREGGVVEEGAGQSGEVPPVNDIYRSRQQKRVHVA